MYIKGNIKSRIGFALTIFVLATTLIYSYGYYPIARQSLNPTSINEEQSALTNKRPVISGAKIVSPQKSISEDNAIAYNSKDVAITSDWMTRIGKLTHQERADYAHYDEKTLIALADNGDTKAMDVLTNLYIQRGIYTDDNREKAWRYAEMGSVYGLVSTTLTLALLTLNPPDFVKNDEPNLFSDEKNSHYKLIEALALNQTIAMRGDSHLSEIMKQYNLDSYNLYYNASVQLTALDERAIERRATEIYAEWQKKRLELGLGAFEAPPVSVKKYIDIISSKK